MLVVAISLLAGAAVVAGVSGTSAAVVALSSSFSNKKDPSVLESSSSGTEMHLLRA